MPRDAPPEDWLEYLLGPRSSPLAGSVLLACSDPAVELIARNRVVLEKRFLLDESNPTAQLCMLDKLCTYEAAAAAGVPAARFWPVRSIGDLDAVRSELVYPVIVKPHRSHAFAAKFGRKLLVATSFEEVSAGVDAAENAGVDVLLMEMIPGPDSRLCSYYTYLDENSGPLFHFTKRIIRRYPTLSGGATYHVTSHVPEIPELALALFRSVGLRGLANAEFKLDVRDGRMKLIECNARFTAGIPLLAASGYDLGRWVYDRITGHPNVPLGEYAAGLHLWSPLGDARAFLELRSRGELTTKAWLQSLMHRQVFSYLDWRDPGPGLGVVSALLQSGVHKLVQRRGI